MREIYQRFVSPGIAAEEVLTVLRNILDGEVLVLAVLARRRRLPADRVKAEDLVCDLALHVHDVKPCDVPRRVRRSGDGTLALGDDERIGVTLERARRREVPLGAEALARRGVRDEVVLAKHFERVEEVQEVDDDLNRVRYEVRPDVVEVVLDGGESRVMYET